MATCFDQTTAILRPVFSRKTWCILKLYKIMCQMDWYLVLTDSGKKYFIHFPTRRRTPKKRLSVSSRVYLDLPLWQNNLYSLC